MLLLTEKLNREILVFLIGATPVLELRGAIPIGIGLGLSPIHSTILSVLGNIAIVPILLGILNPLMDYFEKTVFFTRTIGWVKARTLRRTRGAIRKYSILGLFLLVAIPLPTTGAWTGCLAASLFRIDYRKSLMAISTGVLVAGLIVYIISYQVVGIIN